MQDLPPQNSNTYSELKYLNIWTFENDNIGLKKKKTVTEYITISYSSPSVHWGIVHWTFDFNLFVDCKF